MNSRHVKTEQGLNIPLSEQEIEDFVESRVWLAIQQVLLWRIQQSDLVLRKPELSGEMSRFLVGRMDALENLLILPEILAQAVGQRTEKSDSFEENFRSQTERLNHE